MVEVATFDGATRPTATAATWNGRVQTSYNAEQTTVTDQAGKKRRSVTDGLGRLVGVDEPDASGSLDDTATPPQPLQPTNYTYDALGNLVQVDQGTQHRYFTYDSLSRLKTAKNPEQVNSSGTQIATQYDYDDSSNLLTRTNPNGTTVTFTYDGLNRVKTKTLSTGGQWDYTYDTATISNAKGRLVSVMLHNGTDGYYYDGYDVMGRVTSSRQITTAGAANSYSMSYGYDPAGNMTSETYPSGKQVMTEYDSAGRIAGVKKDAMTYYAGGTPGTANAMTYTAHGAIGAMKLGNGKWERTLFNGRLQPTEIDLGASNGASDLLKLEYTYNTTGQANNNGNVLTQTITAPKTAGGNLVLTQNYTYDALNRLSIAEELIDTASQWKQTYDIDRWGNRAVINTSYIPNPALTPQSASGTDFSAFNQNTNRIATGGFGYDTSGNLTSDPTTGANAIVYDAENHQTSYGTSSYSYDGERRRVKKVVGSVTTIFVYNVLGQLIAEYDNSTSPPAGGGTSYLISDHLGSTRAVMKSDGTVARHDYLPFGEEIPSTIGGRSSVSGYSAADSTKQKFTQKERDTESGLDYFLARYYSSAQGRFTSHDPVFVTAKRLIDPQRLNQYVYVRNNPLAWVDPDGMDLVITAKDEEEAKKKFAIYQRGLRQEDRSHTHLVVGDGKNGFAKGQFGITVDKDYKSESENFQVSQKLANDHSAIARVSVVAVGESVTVKIAAAWSQKEGFKLENAPFKIEDAHTPFEGYTFFEFRGKVEGSTIYSSGAFTEAVINGGQDEVQISATMHHELRHVLLGDFGRSVMKAGHSQTFLRGEGPPITEADKQGERAEKEAVENAKKP